jgi:hypothetical protein
MATLWQNPEDPEDFSTDVDSDHEWYGDSPMACKDCAYASYAWRFEKH